MIMMKREIVVSRMLVFVVVGIIEMIGKKIKKPTFSCSLLWCS